MWHPDENRSEQESNPSEQGATTPERLDYYSDFRQRDKKDFLRLGRSVLYDFYNGRINKDELIVLVVLRLKANPRNASVSVSYQTLSDDFRGDYPKNRINKILTSLKRKGYLWYPRRQGKQGTFLVHLDNYPLSKGGLTNLKAAIKQSQAEVSNARQKFKNQEDSYIEPFFDNGENSLGRTPNNDNDNENEKNIENSSHLRQKDVFPERYEITDTIRNRCEEIAYLLGDDDARFTVSACAKFGLDILEQALETTQKSMERGNVRNPGAFFNSLVYTLGEEKIEREQGKQI